MIGRLYVWRGQVWRVLVRGEPFDRGPRRNVLLARVEVVVDERPYALVVRDTGEHVVRPFVGPTARARRRCRR